LRCALTQNEAKSRRLQARIGDVRRKEAAQAAALNQKSESKGRISADVRHLEDIMVQFDKKVTS
jgi:hypothetical protein